MTHPVQAFKPHNNATITTSVTDSNIELSELSASPTVWLDNSAAATGLLVSFDEPCDDDTSFCVPAGVSMPLGRNTKSILHLKRPSGSAAADVKVTPGKGF